MGDAEIRRGSANETGLGRASILARERKHQRRSVMARVIHFEIPVDDADRAVAFYKNAFGWKIEKWNGPMDYWMVNTGDEKAPGINGAIMKRGDVKTTTNTLGVE